MSAISQIGEGVIEDGKIRDQLYGAIVGEIQKPRIVDEINNLNIQDANFSKAVEQIDNVRQFVGTPKHILGSQTTKHGEIAEQVEVGVRRARQALEGKDMTATFDGVGRTAPADYLIDGIAVQSKFINGTNNNLYAVLGHMDKYSNFGRDGSIYHIPKDEYEIIQKIINDEAVDGFRLKTIEAIKENVTRIETETGKQFTDVIKPGISTYAEVQQGRVHQTLDIHEKKLSNQNSIKREEIIQDHNPSIAEGAKVASVAGAVGAAVSLTTALYKKNKEGKRFYKGEFTKEDWKEVGIETAKGGAVGAVSGVAIYSLTNYASLSAPFAGAVVSATKGMSSLISDLNNEEINQEEFLELGMVVCSESAVVGIAAAIGQTAIPIPILGAVIGSVAGSMLVGTLGSGNKKTAYQIRKEINNYLNKLDDAYKKLVIEITAEFEKLGELTKIAFDLENNKRLLNSSIELANAFGVEKSKIIDSTVKLDAYILG
jgi:hypothetical protein